MHRRFLMAHPHWRRSRQKFAVDFLSTSTICRILRSTPRWRRT